MSRLKVDLHVHTDHSKDSRARPGEVVARALDLGFDAIAVTDHGTVRGSLDTEKRARGTPLLVIPGQEVKTGQGEVVILGLRETVPEGMPALETVRLAKEKGGFVIVPHPFDLMRHGLGSHVLPCLEHIDAVEAFNSRTIFSRFNRKALDFARERGIPVTAGSDSHFLEEMGKAYMLVDSGRDQESILEAVRSGKAELVTRKQGLPRGIKRGLLKIRTYF